MSAQGRDVVVTSRGAYQSLVCWRFRTRSKKELSGQELIHAGWKLVPGIRLGTGGKPLGAKRPIRIGRGRKTLAQIVLEERR